VLGVFFKSNDFQVGEKFSQVNNWLLRLHLKN